MKLLIINPGSTSTKISVFEEDKEIFRKTIGHSDDELQGFHNIFDQREFRKKIIIETLESANFRSTDFSAVCSRGGLVRHIPSGTYRITDQVIMDLTNKVNGEHASNIGPIIAKEIGDEVGIPSFFVDPVCVDELSAIARFSGFAGMERKSFFHALNHKSIARKAALGLNKPYEELNLIVAHLGGGTSVAAHQKGFVTDVFDVKNEGAMSMDRSGSLPVMQVIDLCFSGSTKDEIKRKLTTEGGVCSYLETRDFIKLEELAFSGNKLAMEIFQVFAYQVAKDIGAMAAVLHFEVDAICFTGGIIHSNRFFNELSQYVERLAPIIRFPGEEEMVSLAMGALRVLHGEQAREYS